MTNIFLSFLIPFCVFGWLFKDSRSPAIQAFDNVLIQSAKILEKKYNVSAMGSGGSAPMDVISNFTLSFQKNAVLNKEECRKLLLAMGNDFLLLVNSNQEVKPFLYKYPFEPKDICVTLFFRDQKDNFVEYPYISVASYRLGDLTYKTQKYDREKNRFKTINEERESYEDALKILKGN
ncbi:MAG: hypothetical protein BGO10_01775 [Chlamydia sp. 32-24]|nr:MAG: hypothetical protein BGO10_01775 [Chlamydia sp. 32-24]